MHIYIISIIYTYMCIIVCIGLSTPPPPAPLSSFFPSSPFLGNPALKIEVLSSPLF